eukprot:sb/3463550/
MAVATLNRGKTYDSLVYLLKEALETGQDIPLSELETHPIYKFTKCKHSNLMINSTGGLCLGKVCEIVPPAYLSPTKPRLMLKDLTANMFLPQKEDFEQFLDVSVILSLREIVKRVPQLNKFASLVVRHIPHQHSKDLANSSVIVPCGLLDISEQSTSDMVKILSDHYSKYIPANMKELQRKLLSGGDLYTYIRQLSALLAKANETDLPLHNLQPVFDLWHAMAQIKKHNIVCKQMVDIQTDVHIVGFFLEELKKENISLDDMTEQIFREKVPAIMRKVLEDCIDGDFTHKLRRDGILYRCPYCSMRGSLGTINYHIQTAHINHPNYSAADLVKPLEPDHKFNYIKMSMYLGMVLRVLNDAISEGNGELVLLVWKFLVNFFRQEGNTNYAKSGLTMMIKLKSILSERDAYRQIWNFTVGIRSERGARVADDIFNEFLNNELLKTIPKGKMNYSVMSEHSKALSHLRHIYSTTRQVIQQYEADHGMAKSSRHAKLKDEEQFGKLLKAMQDRSHFKREPRKGFTGFEDHPMLRPERQVLALYDIWNYAGLGRTFFLPTPDK